MKKIKKVIAVLLAISISFGVLAMTASAAEPDPVIVPYLLSEEETNQLVNRARMSETGTVYLPRNNATGTNGNACGEFNADGTGVTFLINRGVAGATNFNVQLYVGKIGAGYKAAEYECVSVRV